jgi:hypothetical protein
MIKVMPTKANLGAVVYISCLYAVPALFAIIYSIYYPQVSLLGYNIPALIIGLVGGLLVGVKFGNDAKNYLSTNGLPSSTLSRWFLLYTGVGFYLTIDKWIFYSLLPLIILLSFSLGIFFQLGWLLGIAIACIALLLGLLISRSVLILFWYLSLPTR